MRRKVARKRTYDEVLPSKEYELSVPLDGSSYQVRENLQDILVRELCGPSDGDDELVDGNPKNKYLLGRIAPTQIVDSKLGSPEIDENAAEDDELEPYEDVDDDDTQDRPQKRGLVIPSSMGLRFQVPADLDAFTVHCSWATYSPESEQMVETADGGNAVRRKYRRTPQEHAKRVQLAALRDGETSVLDLDGKVVLMVDRCVDASDPSRLLIEVALCNQQASEQRIPVSRWLFQTALNVDADGRAVFLPVHDWNRDESFSQIRDEEEKRLALQYRDRYEFAVGRTCSVDWSVSGQDGSRAVGVRTTWVPTAEVPQTEPGDVPGAQLDMMALADMDGNTVRESLMPIADAYGQWLDAQQEAVALLAPHLRATAMETVDEARQVHAQLVEGIEFLATDGEALRCFGFMNRVMAEQRVHTQIAALRAAEPDLSLADAEARVRAGGHAHRWRVFQLAFILMQVRAMTDPAAPVRSDDFLANAQLLFFPTGGGKTEAYLGLAAYTFAIRRRQGVVHAQDGDLDGNAGVAVLMRYTLRLLTSQQFQRASTLVCAAELERLRDPGLWGKEPFRIGLWVGTNVTPKRVKEAARDVADKRERGSAVAPDVLQIVTCPWCGQGLGGNQVDVNEAEGRVRVHCSNARGGCPFARGGQVADGIPVLTTDEEIYRLVPAFVIATVDKFARLAREGMASSLFGYVGRRCNRHGYVPLLDADGKSDYPECMVKDNHAHPAKDGLDKAYVHPCGRLRPPDLVIQDELHLITGALGTTVGLFEGVIDVLSSWRDAAGRQVKPMIVASSATVRNASDQIRNLYARGTTMFPPQVLDASDTFFSREIPCDEDHPGRRYVGLSTTGVRLSATEIQTAETLLRGAQRLMDEPGGGDATDPYMTLVGYFSSTRELAGMARFLQDDIAYHVRLGRRGSDLPTRRGSAGGTLNVGELTSRIASSEIVRTLERMSNQFSARYDTTAVARRNAQLLRDGKAGECVYHPHDKAPYDVVLATSMLQVGVDVPRLGLMMIVGQPKNTAEYIQASSRVGRDPKRPGLVVTLGNWARPRDLAHFEQFKAYHESFYAHVEPLSVTPFSVASLERGVSGLLVSAARAIQGHVADGLTAERNAFRIDAQRDAVERLAHMLATRIDLASAGMAGDRAATLLRNRVDAWQDRAKRVGEQGDRLAYERCGSTGGYEPLIASAEEIGDTADVLLDGRFLVANSMREVQPEINILVSPDPGRMIDDDPTAPAWQARPGTQDDTKTGTRETNGRGKA